MKSKSSICLSRKGWKRPMLCMLLLCATTWLGTMGVRANDLPVASEIQQKTLTGVVSDASGLGIPGANVLVKGTTIGVTTDMDGKYSVRVPDASAVIQFSFIGYVTQEIPVGTQAVLNVKLEESVIRMEEVVVTALGMKRQAKSLSYSATEVKGDELGQTSDVNIINSLQGKIAGVSIDVYGSGNTKSSVIIRGNTRVTGEAEPMYVVDGMPGTSSALTTINPADIESMNVMKGAAATALYGSRASNGLIVITTKKGSSQKGIGVSYSGSASIENYGDPYKGRQTEYGTSGANGDNSDLYPSFWNEETHRAWGPRFDGKELGIYFNNDERYPLIYQYKEKHWDEFMQTGTRLSNALSFSGGNDKQKFRFSVSDLRQVSPIPNSDMNRQTINFSTNSKFGERITLDAGMRYTTSTTQNTPSTYRYIQMMSIIPTNWDINWLKGPTDKLGAKADGSMLAWSTNDYYPNPFWSAYQNSNRSTDERINAYASLRYDITDWLYATGRVSINTSTGVSSDVTAYGDARTNSGTGYIRESADWNKSLDADYSLVFNKDFNKFNVNALFGGSIVKNKYNLTGINGDQLIIPYYHVVTNAGQFYANVNSSESGTNSLYGSAEVSYDEFLYLTVTGRNDWFSTLSPANNSLFYPSVGLSYLFSNHLDLPSWFTFGKLRASYAKVGGGTSAYMTKFGYSFDATGYMDTPTLSVPGTIPNSDLRPYKTREYEIGVDLRFLKNRIGIDYAYYDKETSDDIVTVTIPQASGYTGAKVNLGSIGNKGHEFTLTLVPYAGAFRWEMNLMYSYNKSEVLDLGASSEVSLTSFSAGGGGSIKQIVGQRANAIYGYKQQYTEDGQPIWERWSFNYGGQQHYSWRPARNATQELLGYGGNPNMGSFTTTFTYKGVTLSAMIDAKWGGDMIYVGEQEMIERGQSVQTLPGRDGGLFLDGVYKVGDNYVDVADAAGYTIAANPAQNRPSAIVVAGNEIPYHVKHFENFYREGFTKRVSDKVMFDASYAKLREISLGYSLPQATLKKWGLPVQSVRMTLVGRNLLDLYNDLPSGDPSTLSGSTMGVNNYALPALRSYTFNLDINF